MQIPGLNLLSGRTSTDPSNEVCPPEQNNMLIVPLDGNEISNSELPPSDILNDAPNSQSTTVITPAVEDVKDPFEQEIISATNAVEDNLDPLDLALEESSDRSPAESNHGEDSEDDGRY
jgi:hypothetical protein